MSPPPRVPRQGLRPPHPHPARRLIALVLVAPLEQPRLGQGSFPEGPVSSSRRCGCCYLQEQRGVCAGWWGHWGQERAEAQRKLGGGRPSSGTSGYTAPKLGVCHLTPGRTVFRTGVRHRGRGQRAAGREAVPDTGLGPFCHAPEQVIRVSPGCHLAPRPRALCPGTDGGDAVPKAGDGGLWQEGSQQVPGLATRRLPSPVTGFWKSQPGASSQGEGQGAAGGVSSGEG